ncbi:MAG: response regulator [Mariprofundus sp.]
MAHPQHPAMDGRQVVTNIITRQRTDFITLSTVTALIVTGSLWSVLNHSALLYWLFAILVTATATHLLRKQNNDRLQALLFALHGLGWGMSAPLFLPMLEQPWQMLLLLIVIALISFSAHLYTERASLLYLFISPVLLLMAGSCFMQGSSLLTTVGILTLLYAAALLNMVRRYSSRTDRVASQQPISGTHAVQPDYRQQSDEKLTLLQQAVDASSESIMILDAEGVIESANRAATTLYQQPLSRLVKSPALQLCGGQTAETTGRTILHSLKQGVVWAGDQILYPHDGSEKLLNRHIYPICDDSGRMHHIICIDRDITTQSELSKQLEHTQRLQSLGLLASGIAHDFNNLLTAIMGNAALADRMLDDTSKAKPYLLHIEQCSDRAADLCKQMLDYSGKGLSVVKPMDLNRLISDMTRLMEVALHPQVVIRYDLHQELPPVDGDIAQIQQVVMNLMTNANEAIGEQGGMISFTTGIMHADQAYLSQTVTSETLPDGDYVFMEVSDNGCGMDEATRQKLFDPFFTTKFSGRGLGMSAILGIIQSHHGAIRVYSEKGKGTTFKVLLPASQQQLNPAANEAIVWHAEGTILVVDDEITIRETASAMLEDMGFDIVAVGNGKEAVALYQLRQQEITAILLDMTMPKMDGRACMAELMRINPDVKVIMSSGYSEEHTGEQLNDMQPAGFIQKPYSPDRLYRIMRHCLSK